MVTRTAALRLQLIDAASGPSRGVVKNMRALDEALGRLGKAGSPHAKRLTRDLEQLQRKGGKILEFREARRGLKDASIEMKAARTNVQRLEMALRSATKPTKKMESDLRAARTSLKQATSAFKEQGQAVRKAEAALRSYGVNGRSAISRSQKAVRDQIAQTIREIRKLDSELRKQPPAPRGGRGGSRHEREGGIGTGGAVAGGFVADRGRAAATRGFGLAVDFSQAADFQQALGGFSDEERKKLNRQAEKIGGDTRFTNADVVNAQTSILQGGIRDPETIMNLTRQVTDYALAMGVTLEEGAETIKGAALSKRIDLKDGNAIKQFIDFMVWMAKNSGMSDDDVRQYMKYGGAATTGAGLPDPYMAAMGMILRRSGVRGDEAGVFARAASSKLVAPTNKGRRALYAMGINYDDFTTMPDSFNTKGVGKMLKSEFGKTIPAELQKEIEDLLANGEFTDAETGESRSVASDRGEFVARMSELLEPLFGGKNGKMSAKDANALAKALGDYHKMSVESIDTVGLWNAIMSNNPSLAQLNAFFTDKQGGRANMIAQQWAQFQAFLKMMENVEPGVANKIGDKANEGLYGDWTRLTGTIETALTRAVQDWETPLRGVITWTDKLADSFINADTATRRLVEAILAAGAVVGAYGAAKGTIDILNGLRGRKGGGGGPIPGGASGIPGKGSSVNIGGRGALGALAAGSLLFGMPTDDAEMLDFMRKNHERTRNFNDWLESKFGSPKTWRDSVFGAGASPGGSAVGDVGAQLDAAMASWPEAAKRAMEEYGSAIQEGGAGAEAKAAQIAAQIEQELNVTGYPKVDTSQLERALSLARQLAAAARGGGGDVGTPANSAPFGGPREHGGLVKRGVTYLVGEDGPEPFTPSQNGHVTSNRDWQAGAGGSRASAGRSVIIKMTNHIHLGGKATKEDGEEIGRMLDRQLNRSAQVAFADTRYGDA